ncbi:hypothetical protein [Ruminococcus albus]|uniref:Uncharacterized protein n=1 Tax=Ruminococcus albus TaxID=1264 RepID=A0A1I1LES8_RUMAL|nr:hypothetical protein [Ruminococcus albus]SFC71505.1 hypothetical protein SAMN02910406_02251 [Ruminococcus albus]
MGADMPAGYGETMNYINETKVDDYEFLRFRITERFNQVLRDVYSANVDRAEKNIPSAISDSNKITGFMLELLDQVKAGNVEIETPMDTVALMMVKMGVSEQKMVDVLGELSDDGDSISEVCASSDLKWSKAVFGRNEVQIRSSKETTILIR